MISKKKMIIVLEGR